MFIVGFTGRAGVGKDTAGSVLVNHLGFTRFAFADPIKKGISAMMGWSLDKWSDRQWKEMDLPNRNYSPRFLAQTLGTEWARNIVHRNFWLHATESLIHESLAELVVITDVRFNNEAEWIQRHGGWVIELRRVQAGLVHDTALHISENGVDSALIDFAIMNDRSQEDFERRVEQEVSAKLSVLRTL